MYINNDIDYLKFLRDKEIYIFGAGIKGEKCCHRLEKLGYCILNFIDNDVTKYSFQIEGKNIISLHKYQADKTEKSYYHNL